MHPFIHVGDFHFPSFFLVQSLTTILCLWWLDRRAAFRDFPRRESLDLALLVLAAGTIGGRLLHVLWEEPRFYWYHSSLILNPAAGGFVYFGGLILSLPAALLYLRRQKEIAPGRWLDLFAPVVSLGTGLGRIGCQLAGCCYGAVCDLPWAQAIRDERGLILFRHPAPIYSLMWESVVLTILVLVEKIDGRRRPSWLRRSGSIFLLWIVLHCVGRFFLEIIRDDFRGARIVGLTISQVLSLVFVASALWLMHHRARKHSGNLPSRYETGKRR